MPSTRNRKQAPLPELNTIEEYNPEEGNSKMIRVAKTAREFGQEALEWKRDTETADAQLPGITEYEWHEIVNSMTAEEWALYITTLESEANARRNFDLRTTEWPGLVGQEKGTPPGASAAGPVVVEEESVVTQDYLRVGDEVSLASMDGFVAIDDEDDQSWSLLSGRDDADSAISWSTAPLSFREALLSSDDPMRDKAIITHKASKRVIKTCVPKPRHDGPEETDDTLFELRESAKTMRGGKPVFRADRTRRHCRHKEK